MGEILRKILACPKLVPQMLDVVQFERDLFDMIERMPAMGVRAAGQCLCVLVKYVTKQLSSIVNMLNKAIPVMDYLLKRPLSEMERLYMCRQLYIVTTILENLQLDNLPVRKDLLHPVLFSTRDGTLSERVLQLLTDCFKWDDPTLKAVAISCLGFFLSENRQYIARHAVKDIIASAVESSNVKIRLKSLEMIAYLLQHFGQSAEVETSRNFTGVCQHEGVSAVEAAQPLHAHLDGVLNVLYREEDINAKKQALTVVKYLHVQGLLNPVKVFPQLVTLTFNDDAIAPQAGEVVRTMLSSRPQILINRLDVGLRASFVNLVEKGKLRLDTSENGAGEINMEYFAAVGRMYAELRKQKTMREKVIQTFFREMKRNVALNFETSFPELREFEIPSKDRDALPATKTWTSEHIIRLLYSQFLASVLCSLPFGYENEVLFVIYNCQQYLTLHADALVAEADAEVDTEVDIFSVTSATAVYVTLKNMLKTDYGLSLEKCQNYEPSMTKNEKLKHLDDEEKGTRFPLKSFYQLASRISMDNATNLEVLKDLIQQDPLDVNHHRSEKVIERLEKKNMPKTGKKRGRPQASQTNNVTSPHPSEGSPIPAAKSKRGAEENDVSKRIKGTPKVKAKAKAKSKPKGQSDDDDETSSESESSSEEEASKPSAMKRGRPKKASPPKKKKKKS